MAIAGSREGRISNPLMLEEYTALHGSVQLIGRLGAVARGSMGLDVSKERALQTMHAAVDYVVHPGDDIITCMDDGQANGSLAGTRTPPRQKTAGGSSVGNWLAGELTFTHRLRTDLVRNAERYPNPADRLAAASLAAIKAKFELGAHTRKGPHGSGCGMVDESLAILSAIPEEANRPDGDRIAAFTAGLMRPTFSFQPAVHEAVVADANRLTEDLWRYGWEGYQVLTAIGARTHGSRFVDDHAVEVTTGEHAPDVLIMHYGSGTFDRDPFVAATGRKALWVDEAAILKTAIASAINPRDAGEVGARYQTLLTSNVAAAVGLGGEQLWLGVMGNPPAQP